MNNLKEVTKTDNLRVVKTGIFADGRQYRAVIRLNDECKNGHEDFSITGDIWEKGKPKTDRYMITGGAIGDELAKLNKNFALINKLHLCDANGIPMHATANMFFHLKQGKYNNEPMTKEKFCKYYRITEEQYIKLSEASDKDHFITIFIDMPEILENWKKEALKAIEWIESENPGLKFVSSAKRSNLILPDADKLKMLKGRVKAGYYDKETTRLRVAQEREEAKKAKIKAMREDVEKKHATNLKELEIMISLIELFGTKDNVIFYTHTNTISFNWRESHYATYCKKWTPQEVEAFKENTNFNSKVEIKYTY